MEPAGPPDEVLVREAQRGDPGSLGALLDRYRPRLYAYALSCLGHGPRAEDAVQDTFLVALQKLDQLREPSSVGGWLYAILRNVCRMQYRGRAPMMSLDELPPGAEPRAMESVEEGLDRSAMRDWIWTALSELPEGLRVTAMLRYFGSYSAYEEIAATLGVPVGTVRSRLSQAKVRLAEALLKTAGLDHSGERKERERRSRYYMESWSRVYRGDKAALLSDFTEDLVMVFPDGETFHGRAHLEKDVHADSETGTLTLPVRGMSSGGISIVEARFQNSPEHPFRCPPGGSFVMFHHEKRIRRVHLYTAPRPPRPPE